MATGGYRIRNLHCPDFGWLGPLGHAGERFNVEANTFTSELVLNELVSIEKDVDLCVCGGATQTADSIARFQIEVEAGERTGDGAFVLSAD